MRKLIIFLFVLALYGCSCIGQIPTQYVYVDSLCQAEIPDYSGLVIVFDNCDNPTLVQTPLPGTVIDQTTTVTFTATDAYGNSSSASFSVVTLDTIPPTIQLDPAWTGYTDQEVGDMYRTFYGWVQNHEAEFNQLHAGDTMYVPEFDLVYVQDSIKVFHNTIEIPDNLRSDWWWASY